MAGKGEALALFIYNGATPDRRRRRQPQPLMDICPLDGFSSLHRARLREEEYRRRKLWAEALRQACVDDRPDLVKNLLTQDAPASWADDWGRLPIHWAASLGNASCVELLGARCDPWALDAEGFSPAELARAGGHLACAELIESAWPRPAQAPQRLKAGPNTALLGLARTAAKRRGGLSRPSCPRGLPRKNAAARSP